MRVPMKNKTHALRPVWGVLTVVFIVVTLVLCLLTPNRWLEEISNQHRRASNTEEGLNLQSHFRIIVLSMDRFDSLNRLLNSLRATDFAGDRVELEIQFDRPSVPTEEWWNKVENFGSNIDWKVGRSSYRVASSSMGLRKAWLNAWRPSSPAEQAIIFEDDVEVSPLWYRWLKGAHQAYKHRSDIAGIALQRQRLVPDKSNRGGTIDDNQGLPFLYKLVGSIGFAPRASVWMNFLDFAECAIDKGVSVETPALITSDWYRAVDKSSMWTQLFVYFCHYYSELYTLYLFPSGQRALAAHWQEKGEHFPESVGKDFALANQVRLTFPDHLPKLGWDATPNLDVEPLETLVMSAAVGYQYDHFERFLRTLRKNYDGDLLLLIGLDATPEIMTLVDRHRAQVVLTSASGGKRGSKEWMAVNQERWKFYKESCHPDKYDLCMAVDFRDIVFQDDPFINMNVESSRELYVYEHNLIMNSWHLEEAKRCGHKKDILINKPIINAGGLAATPPVFGQLVDLILGKFKSCDDQIALNLAVYGREMDATIHSYPQGGGSINNVAWDGKFRRDSQGRFLNHDCFPSPVVHQFDVLGKPSEKDLAPQSKLR